jgi:hypothetical protein
MDHSAVATFFKIKRVDGIPLVLSLTRAELFRIVAANLLLSHFMKFHHIESKSKCVKCVDNRSAISRVNQTQNKNTRQWWCSNDIDIVTMIVETMKELTLRHQLRWVYQKSLDFRLDSGSTWLDGVNGILMQQEPNLPKQDYCNWRAIASLANTLITVVEPVPTLLLSLMLLLQL